MEDGWWHLATARWIVSHRAVPHVDVFPLNGEPAARWTYTQALGGLILYEVNAVTGDEGLRLLRALFFAGLVLLYVLFAQKRIPWPMAVALSMFLVHGLAPRDLLRPLIFNFLFIQIFLIRISAYRRTGRWRELALLAPLAVVWNNIHLGSFIYGYATVGVAWLAALLETLLPRLREDGARHIARKQARELGLLCLAFAAILFLNPYGFQGALYPFRVFFQPDYIYFYKFYRIVEEMLPPAVLLTQPGGMPFIALFIFTAGILLARWKGNLFWVLLFGYAAGIFASGVQGAGFFAIVGVYAFTAGLQELSALWRNFPGSRLEQQLISFGGLMVVLLTVKIGCLLTQRVVYEGKIQAYEVPNPVAAVRFLSEHGIRGKVFNDERFGGYLLWNGYPALQPFVDGRQVYPERFFNGYNAVLNDPARYWPQFAQRFGFDIVLLGKDLPLTAKLLDYLRAQTDWQVVYSDGSCVVLLKRS